MTIIPTCPTPILQHETVQMAHGAGGRLSQALMHRVFMPHLHNAFLDLLDDQAKLDLPAGRIAFTTDTYVVSPVFFPVPTSESLPSTAQSTIWRLAEQSRSTSVRALCSKRDFHLLISKPLSRAWPKLPVEPG